MKEDFTQLDAAIKARNKEKRRFRIMYGTYNLSSEFVRSVDTITLFELKFHGWEYFGTRKQPNS